VENGILQEILVERSGRRGLVGNIYKGSVSRVLPGMQAAFIDIGLDRTGFLHTSDIVEGSSNIDGDDRARIFTPSIDALLKEGQEVLVQVIKDPLGSKGARLTTHLSVPSRYLVFMPAYHSVGVSQKIENDAERERLRDIVLRNHPGLRRFAVVGDDTAVVANSTRQVGGSNTGGYILRTAAEGISEDKLCKDMDFLRRLWDSVMVRAEHTFAPGIVYEDMALVMRTMRDLVDTDIEKVRIDSEDAYQRVLAFAKQFIPDLVDRIELYSGERPILDLYMVEDEIQKALERKVQLKSGGFLVIDQTEAMTTIDINTGAFVGHRNLEETIFKTNLEAAQAIARQLRLRNLGGIIIVDFIDMSEPEHRRQVLRALEKSLQQDNSNVTISEVSSLGLVQITRKRTRESLEHILCEPCPTCNGRSQIKTAETVCYEIFREILREVRQYDAQKLLVVASQSVVDRLLDDESRSVAELEQFVGRPITFQVETPYTQEQYDIVLL
ncbi:MAG: Rne/Rng family ribonuclease, partial [Gammaproteobacteria bacterium]|nr:Rne/Rng family ribonuclease [Gammaproteobacteria bacterium]